MSLESNVAQTTQLVAQFRASHRRAPAFYESLVCNKVEPRWDKVLGFIFHAEDATIRRRFSQAIYAGFYRASLTVNIQIADQDSPEQVQVQQTLQQWLTEKKERGEFEDRVVLIKNPLGYKNSEIPERYAVPNGLTDIDGQIFVINRNGEIIRPVTDTSPYSFEPTKNNPAKIEEHITKIFQRYARRIPNSSALPIWNTQTTRPGPQN